MRSRTRQPGAPRATLRLAIGAAVAVSGWTPASGDAQLAEASARSLAMAGNTTASVSGFGAISVNPAGLAGSGFSLAVLPVQSRLGLSPIGLDDLIEWEGRVVPAEVREEWLERVIEEGSQSGAIGADVTALALTLGSVGFQLSTSARGDVDLPPGVVEAILYGNSGRTGSPRDLEVAGASVEGYAMSTAALAFALPVGTSASVGITGKYSWGHGLVVGRSESGTLRADPLGADVEFPLVTSCTDEAVCSEDLVRGGSGFGLDLGAMLELGTLTVGAALHDVIGNFSWDADNLGYRPGTITLRNGSYEADYGERPLSEAPADLRQRVADVAPKPSLRVGAALDLTPKVTLTGDIHARLVDGGLTLEPSYRTGVGLELDLGAVAVMGGAAKISDGVELGGGAALGLGPAALSGAAGLRTRSGANSVRAQLALSFGNR